IIRVQVDVAGRRGPFRIGEPWQAWNLIRVGLGRIAHPDPHRTPLLVNGIAPDLGATRNERLSRHLDALTMAVEFQPVIAAGEMIAVDLALRQRRRAMAAAILERPYFSRAVAKQHDLVV